MITCSVECSNFSFSPLLYSAVEGGGVRHDVGHTLSRIENNEVGCCVCMHTCVYVPIISRLILCAHVFTRCCSLVTCAEDMALIETT